MTSIAPSVSAKNSINQFDSRRLERELILAEVLNVSRESVFAHPERRLTPDEAVRFEALWARVEAGEPVAYVLGKKEFYGLEFAVDARVLIPRPETELLVEAVLDCVKSLEWPVVLEVGTGSGAIAVVLAKALPQARVLATDISEEALCVARHNAARWEVGVEFFQADLLTDLPWTECGVDVVVANLPYIGRKEFDFIQLMVERYEPEVALFGGDDGLDLYRRLLGEIAAVPAAMSPRWVIGEFGDGQRERLAELIAGIFPAAACVFHRDLASLDRFFVLHLNAHD